MWTKENPYWCEVMECARNAGKPLFVACVVPTLEYSHQWGALSQRGVATPTLGAQASLLTRTFQLGKQSNPRNMERLFTVQSLNHHQKMYTVEEGYRPGLSTTYLRDPATAGYIIAHCHYCPGPTSSTRTRVASFMERESRVYCVGSSLVYKKLILC